MRASARWLRQSGATFTIIVMIASVLLLAIGGAFVDATTSVVKLEGLRDRQETAKEALAGGAEWARVELASWSPEQKTQTATLKLWRADTTVTLERTADGVEGRAAATAKPDVTLGARFLLARRQDRWVVARFELKTAP